MHYLFLWTPSLYYDISPNRIIWQFFIEFLDCSLYVFLNIFFIGHKLYRILIKILNINVISTICRKRNNNIVSSTKSFSELVSSFSRNSLIKYSLSPTSNLLFSLFHSISLFPQVLVFITHCFTFFCLSSSVFFLSSSSHPISFLVLV